MNHIVVDIEASGPVPPIYSMLSIGAVHHENPSSTFYSPIRPFYDGKIMREAMKSSGFENADLSSFPHAREVIVQFYDWVKIIQGNDRRIMFVSDTTSFDFAFVNYYLWHFVGENPFGHAPLSLSNLYKGVTRNTRSTIHKLRDTKHTHHALEDAIGNHEAFLKIQGMMK